LTVSSSLDDKDKIELDPAILAKADVVVADSLAQSRSRGEIHQAVKAGALTEQSVVELGAVLQNPTLGRTSDEQITVADLTGVAVQDIQIAKASAGESAARRGREPGQKRVLPPLGPSGA
jgi:ornithine cyclodeaminase